MTDELPNKSELAMIVKKLEREKIKVAKARDAIRELLSDLEAFDDAWNDAGDSLNYAVERLSELL